MELIKKMQDEIDTLRFFLNQYHKPSDLKVTSDPDFRIMQECDIILLKIIDKICRKNSLDYWLAFGTFLGCYRHGDFIPWDDDTDICMPRADYNRALSIFKEVLAPYGFYIHENRC